MPKTFREALDTFAGSRVARESFGANVVDHYLRLARLEQQALTLTNPFMDYPPVLAWLARHGRSAGARAALERRAEQGRVPYDFMRLSPHFAALTSDPQFTRALALARGQFEDALQVLKEADAKGELPPFLRQPLTDLLHTLGMNAQVAIR